MSTSLSNGAPLGALPKVENMRVAIVAAEWNGHITSALTDGAVESNYVLTDFPPAESAHFS